MDKRFEELGRMMEKALRPPRISTGTTASCAGDDWRRNDMRNST